MPDLPSIYAVKRAVEDELFKRDGVTGVDVGIKEVGGEPTGEIAIRVFVAQKKNVADADAIPLQIEGHPTDVIERTFEAIAVDTSRHDPLLGGIAIGPVRPTTTPLGTGPTVGTLGAVVKDAATGAPMLLSNFHVLCHTDGLHQVGDEIVQPDIHSGGASPGDVVGTLQRFQLTDTVDAAVCDLQNRGNSCAIQDLGVIVGKRVLDHFDVINKTPVCKRGAATQLTFGTISSIDSTFTAQPGDYGVFGTPVFRQQITIDVDPSKSALFADHGDSGSVLVTDANQIVGLVFAKNSAGGASANPIVEVMNALGIEMCSPDLPAVTAVNPSSGVETGGDTVTITGSGFLNATAVGFGAAGSPNFTVVSDTEISADTPAGSGTIDVTVTTPVGASLDTPLDQFQFTPPVEIQAIIPASGPESGGTDVLISGTGFTGAGAATFGGVASVFNVVADDQISATTPPGTGDVDVTVSGPSGVSAAATFSYLPLPTVTSITPSSAPVNVLTNVVIEGSGFTGVQAVMFGGTVATNFNVNDDSHISAVVPPGAQGAVDVTVTTPAGTSVTSQDDEYEYGPPLPVVTSLDITNGPAGGGTPVVVSGSGFTGATDVSFGDGNSAAFTVNSDGEIATTSPAGNAGEAVDVIVTTAVGASEPTPLDGFSYDP